MKQLKIKVELIADYYGGNLLYEASELVNAVNEALQQASLNSEPQIIMETDTYDPKVEEISETDDECDCELEGNFCSGFKGILAHIENGKIVGKVERCDICEVYENDQEALDALKTLLKGGDKP